MLSSGQTSTTRTTRLRHSSSGTRAETKSCLPVTAAAKAVTVDSDSSKKQLTTGMWTWDDSANTASSVRVTTVPRAYLPKPAFPDSRSRNLHPSDLRMKCGSGRTQTRTYCQMNLLGMADLRRTHLRSHHGRELATVIPIRNQVIDSTNNKSTPDVIDKINFKSLYSFTPILHKLFDPRDL